MSLIMCPILERGDESVVSTLKTSSESPSRTECCKPISTTNWAARQAANASNTSIEEGRGIFSSLTTTPIPASPVSAKEPHHS